MQRTMLEIVNQLDGFDSRGNIKVLMATNRPDTLDPALLRPGRLDRKVTTPPPPPPPPRRARGSLPLEDCQMLVQKLGDPVREFLPSTALGGVMGADEFDRQTWGSFHETPLDDKLHESAILLPGSCHVASYSSPMKEADIPNIAHGTMCPD